jgi:hypothetical protein
MGRKSRQPGCRGLAGASAAGVLAPFAVGEGRTDQAGTSPVASLSFILSQGKKGCVAGSG